MWWREEKGRKRRESMVRKVRADWKEGKEGRKKGKELDGGEGEKEGKGKGMSGKESKGRLEAHILDFIVDDFLIFFPTFFMWEVKLS